MWELKRGLYFGTVSFPVLIPVNILGKIHLIATLAPKALSSSKTFTQYMLTRGQAFANIT